MFRVKPSVWIVALALCGPVKSVEAKLSPIASREETDALAERVDLRRCYRADDHWLCTPYVELVPVHVGERNGVGYYGAPGIYLGFRNPRFIPADGGFVVPTGD